MRHLVIVILSSLLLVACSGRQTDWSSPDSWCSINREVDTALVDVFYICSTNVTGENGIVASLTDEERSLLTMEAQYIADRLGSEYNVFSPYYHQLAMTAFALPLDSLAVLYANVRDEVCEAFDYYITNLNQGRPFVVMGFSQGAMLTLDVVKHMSAETCENMLAAYMLGYRLSEADLQHPNVHPAIDATQSGVVASFNTTATVDALWPLLSDDAATCINPLTWTADTTSATLVYDGDTSVLYIDTLHNVLLAPEITAQKYYSDIIAPYCALGNLHLGDLLFYLDDIKDNIPMRNHH